MVPNLQLPAWDPNARAVVALGDLTKHRRLRPLLVHSSSPSEFGS